MDEVPPTHPTPPTQVLEAVIRTRWGALPDAQREGIKTYVSNLIIKARTSRGGGEACGCWRVGGLVWAGG